MQKFLKYAAISVATLLMISGICFVLLSVQDLHAASELIDSLYEKRVVGLSVQGNLQLATQESRRRILYLLTTHDYQARLRHIAYTREADLQVDLLTGRSLMLGLGGEAIRDLHEFGDRWLKYCESTTVKSISI